MTVPVLCGAYVLGPAAGAILGGVFGLVSIWKASVSAFTTLALLFSPFFSGAPAESLAMSLGTRVVFGWLAGMLFVQVRKQQASKLWFAAAILAASIFDSLSVFLCLHLFFPETDIGLGYGLRRLASVSSFINYSIVVLLVFLLDKCLRLPLMRHLASELKYSRDATRSRTFYIVNAVLLAALLFAAFGLMYHFYDRANSLLDFYGIEVSQAVHSRLVNMVLQLLVTTISVFVVLEILVILLGNYFLRMIFQARRDMMTLLLNKNTFSNHVSTSLRENGASSWLMLLDVDNFKKLNDTYGHPNGDKVPIAFAHILRETFASRGIVGRLGGDEFAVYAEDISETVMLSLAWDVCSRVFVLHINGVQGISCSTGITLCKKSESFLDACTRADQALYKSRNAGKNRYSLWTEEA